MKKWLTIVLLLFTCLLIGCTEQPINNGGKEKVTLPDLFGKTLVEAIVEVEGKVEFNPVYVQTNEFLPDQVIAYGGGLKAGDEVDSGMIIDLEISSKPVNAVNHDNGNTIDFVSQVSVLTGPYSELNKDTLLPLGLYGTDLGIPVTLADGKIGFFFGDTFSGANMKGIWNSNFLAVTSDKNYNDGLKFDYVVTNPNDTPTCPAQGRHQSGDENNRDVEVTKIPTGAITIGEYTYLFYMSIRYWGVSGSWLVNYNQVRKSKDLVNWEEVEGLRWDELSAPNFGQIYPFKDPKSDYIYIYGIPGGRSGGCCLGRTTVENFEDIAEYEYLVSKDTWVKGNNGLARLLANEYYVVSPSVAELSCMYNEYLNKYIMVFYRNGSLIMVSSDTPDGVFSNGVSLLNQTDYNGIYGGFIHPELISDGGKCFYMTVSCWAVYNVYWVKVVLK